MPSRRSFLKTVAAGAAVTALPHAAWAWTPEGWLEQSAGAGASASAKAWAQLPAILARIKAPTFPDKTFDITAYGAVGDNKTDNTEAFKKAIAACHAAGGGRVVVPAGEFITGAIELKSHVNLHLAVSASVIRFTHDQSKYPNVFTRWEGMECMNFSPFIYAFEQENLGITGAGTIDGNCDCTHWWPWKGRTNCGWKKGDPDQAADREKLYDYVARAVPVKDRVFGQGHYLRPQFIQPYRSKNIVISGVKLLNAPMWQVHPVLCTNVTIQDLHVECSILGPNTDGCDPESCTDVLIKNCFFDVGDDCIAIKAGRNDDGRRVKVPSTNIVIQDCRMKNGHGGITVGSEISAGVSNVFAENCKLDSPDLDFAVRVKNNALRGGLLENIYVRNLEIGQVAKAAVTIDFSYEEGEAGPHTPVCRHVIIEGVKAKKAEYAALLKGFAKAPITDVSFIDCDFQGVTKGNLVEHVQGITVDRVKINGKAVTSLT